MPGCAERAFQLVIEIKSISLEVFINSFMVSLSTVETDFYDRCLHNRCVCACRISVSIVIYFVLDLQGMPILIHGKLFSITGWRW